MGPAGQAVLEQQLMRDIPLTVCTEQGMEAEVAAVLVDTAAMAGTVALAILTKAALLALMDLVELEAVEVVEAVALE